MEFARKKQDIIKSFGELKVGELFGFLKGSCVDRPYDDTKRAFMKTNGNFPPDDPGKEFWESFSNAVAVGNTSIFIVEPKEQVIVLERR